MISFVALATEVVLMRLAGLQQSPCLRLELLRRGFSFFWDSKDKKLGSWFEYHPLNFKVAI